MTAPTPPTPQGGAAARIVDGLVGVIERRPWSVLLTGLAVGVLSVWLATQLRVTQDLKALLPPDSPSLERLSALKEQVGNLSDLLVEVRSPDRDANIRFGQALSERLGKRDDIRYSVFHQDRAFFEKNGLLYLSVADLLDVRARVIRRIASEVAKDLADDFDDDFDEGEGDDEDAAASDAEGGDDTFALSEEELRKRYAVDDKMPEYFEADEGRIVVVKARPTKGTTDVAFTKALLAGVEADIGALQPASYHPEMTAEVVHTYATRRKTVRTAAGDAARGGLAATILLLLCLWAWFRRLRDVALVMVPLLLSATVALAYAQLRFGFLNLVSTFIFAVLLGIGIDFGLHVLSRYQAERLRQRGRTDALKVALSTTGMSTLAGAVSTIGVYGFLMVADFQGFAQFGEIAAVGITVAVLSVFTLVPALVVVTERRFPFKPGRRKRPPDESTEPDHTPPRPRRVWAAVIALAIFGGWAAWSAVHASEIAFEYEFNKLGPKPEPAAEGEPQQPKATFADAMGRERLYGPVIALTSNLEQTRWLHRLLTDVMQLSDAQAANLDAIRAGTWAPPPPPKAAQEPAGGEDDDDGLEDDDPVFVKLRESVSDANRLEPASLARMEGYATWRLQIMNRTLARVWSVYSFIPERQADKLLIIKDIKRRVDLKRSIFEADDKEEIDKAYPYLEVTRPVGVADLPKYILDQLTDQRGDVGHFVVLRNRGSKANYKVSSEIHTAFFDLQTPQGDVATAGNLYVMPEMLDTVAADGPVVIALALLVVFFTALALFRSFLGVSSVLVTVVAAVLGLLGVMHALGWKANFFNLVAIPLLLGMGQDYALHFFHRYRHDGIGRLGRALRETGGAVFMTTLTTVIGFGGILFANHRGLLSLAWASVVGLIFCLVAAVVVLPSILVLLHAAREALAQRKR